MGLHSTLSVPYYLESLSFGLLSCNRTQLRVSPRHQSLYHDMGDKYIGQFLSFLIELATCTICVRDGIPEGVSCTAHAPFIVSSYSFCQVRRRACSCFMHAPGCWWQLLCTAVVQEDRQLVNLLPSDMLHRFSVLCSPRNGYLSSKCLAPGKVAPLARGPIAPTCTNPGIDDRHVVFAYPWEGLGIVLLPPPCWCFAKPQKFLHAGGWLGLLVDLSV